MVAGTVVTLTDIVFAAPGAIWSVGGFQFAASGFYNIATNLQGGKNFSAVGTLTAAGFDPTPGQFHFSSQTGLSTASFSASTSPSPVPLPAALPLLLATVGGLGLMGRRRNKT